MTNDTLPATGKLLYLCPADTPEARETANQLRLFGYETRLLVDVPSLLAAVEAAPPAGVLLDCGALCRQGEQAERALREMSARAPLACISPQSDMASRLRAVRMGCQAYLTRPLDIACWIPWTGSRHRRGPTPARS